MLPALSSRSERMELMLGLALVFVAGLFQGSFIMPMTLTRDWRWEHTWAGFSLLGMLIFNWAIGLYELPHLAEAIGETRRADVNSLLVLGGCWGAGAILFGLGMEKLGMAVGYPVIMGLILSLGALIPLAQLGAKQFATAPGLLLLAGTLVVVVGIALCSRAATERDSYHSQRQSSATVIGLIIAVFAGFFSCLPNVGLNNAKELTAAAARLGAGPATAGNAAWVVLFTAGFAVNFIYCIFLIAKRRNAAMLGRNLARNSGLVVAMALLWIGSFYLYGMGAAHMGRWGTIIGWPLFISLAILVGNLWGLWRGEWTTAMPSARAQLSRGFIVVLSAVVLFGVASALQ
jgi:L-rhamnose-H+ transport protein